MSRHDALYDLIVEVVAKAHPEPVPLEAALQAAENAGLSGGWAIPRFPLTNALHMRGVKLANGMLCRDVPAPEFEPLTIDYTAFVEAAVRVITEATAPLTAIEIIGMSGITGEAIPSGSLSALLKPHGIYLIPGVGFWRGPQYIDPSGRIVTARAQSDAVREVLGHFERHGWPILGSAVQEETEGGVTSRYIARLVAKGESDAVAGIGSGMYVPYALRTVKPLPVSPNVARAMLDVEGNAIDDKDHLRLFRLALILERHELATLKKSRTTRGGLRRQTAIIVLTDEARQWLESIASGPRDAF